MAIIQDPLNKGRTGAGKGGSPEEGYHGPTEMEPAGAGSAVPGGPTYRDVPVASDPQYSPWWKDIKSGAPVNYETQAAEDARRKQMEVIQMLQRQAQGDPNSIMQQQLQSMHAANRGQMGGAAAARGNFGGAGAGMRLVRAAQGASARQQVDDSRVLMLQEQQAALSALKDMYNQAQQQDASAAGGAARNALGNYATEDDFIKAMLGIDTQFNIDRTQQDADNALVRLGMGLDQQRNNIDLANRFAGSGATAAGAFEKAFTPAAQTQPGPPPPMPANPEYWDSPYKY